MNLDDINDTLDKRLTYNKWELLYQYATKRLDEDIERFHKLDEKITKYLNTVTILIGVFVAITSFVFQNHFPPKTFLEWVLTACIFLTFVAFCSAWSFLFRALKLVTVPRMPLEGEIIKLFKTNDNVNTIFFGLTKAIQTALIENKEENKKKAFFLNKAYDDTVYASFFFILVLFLIIILKIFY